VSQDTNGRLNTADLVPVGDQGWLHQKMALAWMALCFIARVEAGLILTYTYGGTYRSGEQQLQAFYARNEEISLAQYLLTPSKYRERFNGKYYRRRKNPNGTYMARVAVPVMVSGRIRFTSNHGLGIAIDAAEGDRPSLARSLTNAAHEWLVRNIQRVGMSYESQEERWHFRYVLGDAFTETINRYVRTMLGRELHVGDSGDDVARYQTKMGLVADGSFGPETEARVKVWQTFFKLPQTGVIDADTRWFLEG
jgi:peptidoglycan hydrolase-like protein with peptidoglycan-binding domain